MNNIGKLLITAFIVIILGLALIQPLADDVESVKISSINVSNESVSLSVTTTTITNESNTLEGNATNLTFDYVSSITELRNFSSEIITGFCNVTLVTGRLVCNGTGNQTIFADYVFNDYSIGTLANDELNSLDVCRNSSMDTISVNNDCNVTLTTGIIRVNYANFTDGSAFINYRYVPDNYVRSAAARTLLTLTILFFAIGIITVGIMFAWKALKDSDVL